MTKTEWALLALKRSGAFALSRVVTRKKLRVLCYHGLWLGGPPHYGDCLYMSEEKFAARMEWLAASGYPVLPFDEALGRLKDGTLPDNAVSITIDDGWYSTYRGMIPVLNRLNLPATLYVTTYYASRGLPVLNVLIGYLLDSAPADALTRDLFGGPAPPLEMPLASAQGRSVLADRLGKAIDSLPFEQRWERVVALAETLGMSAKLDQLVQDRAFHLMTESQIHEAASAGIDIQLHTHTHRMHGFDASLIGHEIERNRAELARITGRPTSELRHFCYPSGVHAPAVFSVLRDHDVVSATTTEFGLVDAADEPMSMQRILDCESFSLLALEARLSGFWAIASAVRAKL